MKDMTFDQTELSVLGIALRVWNPDKKITVSEALEIRDLMELVKKKGEDLSIKDICRIGSQKRDPDHQ